VEHQHYIPRSYIKNFASKQGDKYFVEALHKKTNKIIPSLSTKDICVSTNLYTMQETQGDKFAIEKFYAQNVDSVYPEVYDLLINPEVKFITLDERRKIIFTTMSLYFRTPKFLNAHNTLIDNVFDDIAKYVDPKTGIVNCTFENEKIKFHISEIDNIKKEQRIKNKQAFLATHLELWHNFVEFKLNDGISVFQVEGDIDLITSDNPVVIRSIEENKFNIFDPNNIIQLPLDRRHFLTIFPKTELSVQSQIFRGKRDQYFSLTSNLSVDRNCEEWIFGFSNTIVKHLDDQKKYGAHTEENIKMLEDSKTKAIKLSELLKTSQELGLFHQSVIDKVKEFRELEIFKGDLILENLIKELELRNLL
jgi:hypothetical protein